MVVISLVNHKGGVGKTTSAINIGAGLARKGFRVLVIDADPQANLSAGLGILEEQRSIYNAFRERANLPIVNVKKNLDVVPSSMRLSKLEQELASEMATQTILRELLEGVKGYDYCIIDCPPALGLITINALAVSNKVYIPMQAEYLAYKGMTSIVDFIALVKKYYNAKLEISGVFFTLYNEKKLLAREVRKNVEQSFGERLMDSSIRVNVALSECQSNGVDIFDYDPSSNGAWDYEKLVDEILKN
ncbi:MAG TPA: ParA family protein [Tenuifilaceae bacterium]|nr:ParA family protein [Tenuifilaceae bacterium]